MSRRLLVATAVTRHDHHPAWDRPALAAARQDVVDLFTGRFGYRHLSGLGLDPTRQQLAEGLRKACAPVADDPIGEGDMLAVYITCHGHVLPDTGEHVLITSDTHPDDLGDALSTVDLAAKVLRGTAVRRLLLMLDTCQSGRGVNEIAAAALARLTDRWGSVPGAGMVVIASAQPTEEAATGVFPRLLRDAVEAMPTAGHGPETLDVQVLVDQMNKHLARPGHQRIGFAQFGLTGQPPPFLPNPRHDPALNGVDLAIQQAEEWRVLADEQEVVFRETVVRRAMGSHDAPGGGWWFTGRHTALLALTAWLAGPDPAQPLRVVTGDPGSGKSAVLGLLAALSDPDRRRTVPIHSLGLPAAAVPAPGVIDTRLTVQQSTTEQVLHALAAAAHSDAATPGELLVALGRRERPFTVLLDGVDEAAAPHDLAGRLLQPLVEHAEGRLRLLLGSRPHMLPALLPGLRRGTGDTVVDLDASRYADPGAMISYAVRNLLGATVDSTYRDQPRHRLRPVAEAVAAAAHRSFLVARITASTLATQPVVTDPYDPAWRRTLPRLPGEAMRRDLELRLGVDTRRARDLLLPLAFAQGQGLPWEDIWAPLASRTAGREYTDDDLLWLRDRAGSYIVENTDSDRSAYRLYHQALVEHLRGDADARRVHDAFVTILLDRVPLDAEARTDWTRAHPYTRTYLATHATGAGRVDELVTDPEYLVHADPDTLLPALHHTTADAALITRAVYRNTNHRTLTPRQRRHTLAIDATRFGDTALANELGHDLDWRPRWATGQQTSTALRATLTGHTSFVFVVACTELAGRTVAVTGSSDRTVRVWDLLDGTLRTTLTGHTDAVRAVACTVLDGRPVAVSGGDDTTVRIWDLVDGSLRATIPGHNGFVSSVACTSLAGRPVAVTGCGDTVVRVWDLADGTLRMSLTGHTNSVWAVTCAVVEGRPVAVTGGRDGTIRVWDLTDGSLRTTLSGHADGVEALLCTELAGHPVLVSGGDDHTARIWSLVDGSLRSTLTGHTGWVRAVAHTEADGPVVITGSVDETVRVWSLADGSARTTLTGHTSGVWAVACTSLEGRPVAVTGSSDHAVRVWELVTGGVADARDLGTTNTWTVACTVVEGRAVAVTGNRDGTVRVWDLVDGSPLATYSDDDDWIRAVACTRVGDRVLAVVGSDDGTVRVWSLADGELLLTLTGHTASAQAVACTVVDGRPVAVTGGKDNAVRVWSLVDGTPLFTFTGHTETVRAAACTVVDGRPVAVTGGEDDTVRVWDLVDGSPRFTLGGHAGWVQAVACTVVDGVPVAVVGNGRTLRVWSLVDGALRTTLTGHTRWVLGLACGTVDGRPVAVSGGDDQTVRVWDLTTDAGEVLFAQNAVYAVAMGPNSEIVTSMGWDLAVNHRAAGTTS